MSKRTNSWTATNSIQDSFASFGNALKRELKDRRRSFQLPAARPAPGSRSSQQQAPNDSPKIDNVDKIDNYELDHSSVSQTGSARRGRFSLSGLIIRTGAPHQEPALGPLLAGEAGVGVRQQQHHRNPSQSNVAGHPRPTVSSSFSQPPQLPKPARLSPFGLLSPSSPWSPPASDITPALPPLPQGSIRNVDNWPGANSQLVSPVSETFSWSRRPTPVAKDQYDKRNSSPVSLDVDDRLGVPAPISKFQPTWDPYTGTPLFEEEGFDLHDERSRDTNTVLQAESFVNNNTENNRDGPSVDQTVNSPVTLDDRNSDNIESGWVVLAPSTTKTSERTESQTQLHHAQAPSQERGTDKESLSEGASMAAYAHQQQQPQLQQQQFSPGSYPGPAPVANNYQGQYSQSQAGHPGWHAAAQTPNQAWEQSQLYDYQTVQGQAQGRQPQQYTSQQHNTASQQQQQADESSPHRQSSFVGLPPIRRTSTLLSSVVKAGEDGNDSTNMASSPHTGPQPGSSAQAMAQPQLAKQVQTPPQWQGTPQQYQIAGGYRPSQPGSVPVNQQAYNNPAYQGMQQGQVSPQLQQSLHQGSPGLHSRAFSGPVHPQGIAMAHGDPRFMAQGQGQSPTPQFIPQVMRQNAGALSPNAGGNIRLPPQGAWKLEESHLQQPLISPSRNRSPSNATTPQDQPFYGFDKETGLPAPAPSPSQQQPQQSPRPQPGQQPPLQSSGQHQPGQVPRSDTANTEDTADTADTADLPPPGPIQATDDKHAKRGSGLFSNIRGRFSREGSDDRRDSFGGQSGGKPLSASHHGHPTSDAISESSVATEELQERRKRHSFFGGHALSQLSQQTRQPGLNGTAGNAPPASPTVNSGERPEAQGQQPQQMPPLEKKMTFFGAQAGSGPAQTHAPTRPDMSRASTSSNTASQAEAGPPPAGINGGPKKRFSGLTSMFHRSGNHPNDQNTAGSSPHLSRPSFSQIHPGGAQGFSGGFNASQQGQFARQPGVPGPMFAQQPPLQQPGAGPMFAQQQLRQQAPQQGAQQGPPQGQQQGPPQGQQQGPSQEQHLDQQLPQQFQQAQQVQSGPYTGGQQPSPQQPHQLLHGQQPGQQRPVDQQRPNLASAESPSPRPDDQKTPQSQQYPSPGQQQQQGQQSGQELGQQQREQQSPGQLQQNPSQHSPRQQHPQQFQQQRLVQPSGQQPGGLRQPGQHLPQQQHQSLQHQSFQQQPGQQLPGQQQLLQQQFQQQQRLAQQYGQQQQPGLMGPAPPVGRDSMGSRPFTPGDARPNPMMTTSSHSISEERGRKPSGGSFFSSIFGGRSGSKTRDPKPGQPQGQQAMIISPGQPQPGQQQHSGHFPGQQSNQYSPGQQRIPSPLAQQQQQNARPFGSPGQFGPPQPGQQPPVQSQFTPQGGPGQQQFVHQRQASGQQRPQAPGQQPAQNMLSQGGPTVQQGQVQGNGPRPMMYPQLQSQQSQASLASANVALGQQQTGPANGQRTPSVGGPYPNQQAQGRETAQRTSPGPLNQHPLQNLSTSPPSPLPPPSQDPLRQDTVSPPVDDSASKTGPPGSPPLTSPISQVSTSVPFTPIERQSNDSPLSFRQPAPSQQPTDLNEPPRQLLQASTAAPPVQSPARKPLHSSPRHSHPSQASSVHGGSDQGRDSPSIPTGQTAPTDHPRGPAPQLGQVGPSQKSSPLAQHSQLAIHQQPVHRVPIPGQSPIPAPGSGPQGRYHEQDPQPGAQPRQAESVPPSQVPMNQQGVRLVGQQPGQPGPPTPNQQGQPYPGPQPPWMVHRTATGASGPGPGPQQGQQAPGPYFQTHPADDGQEKESKGTITKLLNKAKEVTHSSSSQDKPEKEKGGKSRFGFLRSSKQPEQRHQAQHQQPLQGGPQFQGPPGRPVMPQESQLERLQQLQAQVSPTEESQPRPSPTPSPGPHLNYQHQRQSPPNGVSPQVQPTTGSRTPSPGPQQALTPNQGPRSGPPQPQQNPVAVPQQGVPHSEPGRQVQGSPSGPGPHGRPHIPGFGQVSKPANIRPVSAAQKSSEPQYGEVPIPTGYGKVHSEGRVEPAPVAYYMGPHGQFLPVQTSAPGSQPQGHPWVQPGTTQRQPSYGGPQQQHPGQGGHFQPQPAQHPITRLAVASPNASTPGFPAGGIDHQQPIHRHLTVQNPDPQTRSVDQTPQSETPRVIPTPNASSPTPEPQTQGHIAPVEDNVQTRPEPERFTTAMSHPSNPASPPAQLQQPGSPQSYPLPDSTFSPVNPDAVNAPAPPLPSPLPSSDLVPSPLRPFGNQSQIAVPEQQGNAMSQASSLLPTHPTPQQAPPASAQFAVDSGGYLQARSPSPQVTPERNISPEPSSLSPPPAMNIDIQQANEHAVDPDNIYDATPRTETISMQRPPPEEQVAPAVLDEPAEPKSGGVSHDVLEHRDQEPVATPSPPQHLTVNTHTSPPTSLPPLAQPAPAHQVITAEPDTTIGANPPGARTTPPTSNNPADIFEEAKRKATLRDMEEKIPVFPTEPDMNAQALAEMAAKKKAEEERPQMSATSYPGQEWNPYGDGFEYEE